MRNTEKSKLIGMIFFFKKVGQRTNSLCMSGLSLGFLLVQNIPVHPHFMFVHMYLHRGNGLIFLFVFKNSVLAQNNLVRKRLFSVPFSKDFSVF